MTRFVYRRRAAANVEAAAYYAVNAGATVALKFLAAVDEATQSIADMPGLGSGRWSDASNPTLKSWPVRGFPYLLFYLPTPEPITILRVLHAARDIPASLRG